MSGSAILQAADAALAEGGSDSYGCPTGWLWPRRVAWLYAQMSADGVLEDGPYLTGTSLREFRCGFSTREPRS